MLSKELIAAILLIGFLATILGGVLTATSVGPDEESDLRILMTPWENILEFKVFWVADIIPLVYPSVPVLNALFRTVTFQSALFESAPGQYVQYILWLAFGIIIVIGFGMWLLGVIRGSGG